MCMLVAIAKARCFTPRQDFPARASTPAPGNDQSTRAAEQQSRGRTCPGSRLSACSESMRPCLRLSRRATSSQLLLSGALPPGEPSSLPRSRYTCHHLFPLTVHQITRFLSAARLPATKCRCRVSVLDQALHVPMPDISHEHFEGTQLTRCTINQHFCKHIHLDLICWSFGHGRNLLSAPQRVRNIRPGSAVSNGR
jgi:hypothetical protein